MKAGDYFSFSRAYPVVLRDLIVAARMFTFDTLTTAAWPFLFFLTFGFGLNKYMGQVQGQSYMVFVLPGLIAMTAASSGFDDCSWSLWYNRIVQKVMNEYRVCPLTTYDIIVGKIISGLVLSVAKTVLVAAILILLSKYELRWCNVPSFMLFIIPGAMLFSCVGIITGTVMNKPEHIGRIQTIFIMPLIFLSGVFFPVEQYSPSVLAFVRLLPTTALFEGARGALLHGRADMAGVAVLCFFAAVFFSLAVMIFNRRMRG